MCVYGVTNTGSCTGSGTREQETKSTTTTSLTPTFSAGQTWLSSGAVGTWHEDSEPSVEESRNTLAGRGLSSECGVEVRLGTR